MNYAGEMVNVEERGTITNNPELSIWKAAGFTLPKTILGFREQLIGGPGNERIQMILIWEPEQKQSEPQ
jgi:hypothetical protein